MSKGLGEQLTYSGSSLDARETIILLEELTIDNAITNISNAYPGLRVKVIERLEKSDFTGELLSFKIYEIKKTSNRNKPLPANLGGYELIQEPKDLKYSDNTSFLNNDNEINIDTLKSKNIPELLPAVNGWYFTISNNVPWKQTLKIPFYRISSNMLIIFPSLVPQSANFGDFSQALINEYDVLDGKQLEISIFDINKCSNGYLSSDFSYKFIIPLNVNSTKTTIKCENGIDLECEIEINSQSNKYGIEIVLPDEEPNPNDYRVVLSFSNILDTSGKVDKISNPINGNLPKLDSDGNLVDSGISASSVLTQHQNISGKADKVTGSNLTNKLVTLDEDGNIQDGGITLNALRGEYVQKPSTDPTDGQILSYDETNETTKWIDNTTVHIKYAANTTPSANDMHNIIQPGDLYIGVYSDNSSIASSNYEDYIWSRIVGIDGTNGKSAYQAAIDAGLTIAPTEAQWVLELKANFGEYLSADYGTNGYPASGGSDIVAADAEHDKIYIVPNDPTTPTANIMFVSVSNGNNGYTWINLGEVNVSGKFNSGQNLDDVSIVQDLNTGGSDKVLSAEAGKTIVETTMELETGLNILSPSTIISKRITRNGDEANISSHTAVYGCTDFIEIGNGVICNHSVAYNGVIYRGAAVYDANKLFIGTQSSSSNGGSLLITKNLSWDDTAAEDADINNPTYVRFNLYNPASAEGGVAYDGETDGYAVYRATELPTPAFQPWHEPYWKQKVTPIQDGAVTTGKIADGAVTPQKTSFFKNVIVYGNILDPNTVKYGVKVNRNTGLESNSKIVYCTDFISIDEKGLYINHAGAQSGVYDGGCVIYNSSKEYIRSKSTSSSGDSLAIPYEDDAAYVRFNIPNANTIDTVYVCRGTQPLPDGYEPYVEKLCVDPDYILTKGLVVSADEIVKAAADAGIYSDEVEVVLPDKFYAVVGDTLQLFYQGMVIAPDFRIYDIYAEDTAIGKGYGRYFEATPNSAGTTTFSLEVSNQNMRLLGSKTCQIVAVNPPSNPATNKNILCIGDSLTAGGKWVCELQRRLKASDGTPQGLGLTNITFVGSMSKTLYGQTANFYGKSGWGWSDFCTFGRAAFRFHIASPDDISEGNVYTNNSYTYTVVEINNVGEGTGTDDWTILCTTSSTSNTPQSSGTLTLTSGSGGNVAFTSAETDGSNLLWDSTNNRINFKKYCTVNAGMTNEENLDYLVLLLTWNQLPSSVDISDWSKIIGYIEDMLDAIHIDYPTCKVKMMGIQFPYIESFVSATNNQHTFATIRRNAFMNKLYQEICNHEEYSDYVEFVNISAQFDSQYNMDLITSGGQTRERDVNTRNSHFKEMFVGNTVHPGTTGYMQIADAAYRVMCAALQGEDN